MKPAKGVHSIVTDDDAGHSSARRIFAHAFSEKALADQEPLIQQYTDQFISLLKESSISGL